MNETLLENTATVVLNKQVLTKAPPCERALGSKANVTRASVLGLQNTDLLNLIQANLIMDYCLTQNKSALEIAAYKEGVSGFIAFLAQCVLEQEANRQQEAAKQTK